MAILLAESLEMDCAVAVNVHHRVAVVFRTRAFHHRDERAVVDASDMVEIILVAVPLKYRQNITSRLQYVSDSCIVFHAMLIADIQPLVSEDNCFLVRSLQVGGQPR